MAAFTAPTTFPIGTLNGRQSHVSEPTAVPAEDRLVHKYDGTRRCARCHRSLLIDDIVSDDWSLVNCKRKDAFASMKDKVNMLLEDLDPREQARNHIAMVFEFGFTAPDIAQRHATIAQAYMMFAQQSESE